MSCECVNDWWWMANKVLGMAIFACSIGIDLGEGTPIMTSIACHYVAGLVGGAYQDCSLALVVSQQRLEMYCQELTLFDYECIGMRPCVSGVFGSVVLLNKD